MRIKKYFNRMSSKIYWIYLLSFTLMLLCICLVLVIGIHTEMAGQLGRARADVLKQVGERINSINSSTITISNLYCYDKRLEEALEADYFKMSAEAEETKEYLTRVKSSYDAAFADAGIEYEIVLIGENGFRYVSEKTADYEYNSLRKQLWYRRFYSRGRELEFISSFKDSFGNEREQVVFGVYRNIYAKDGRRLGTLIVKLKEEILFRLYETILDSKNHIYVIDKDGNIVSDMDKSRLGLNFISVDNFQSIYAGREYHVINKLGQRTLLSYYYDEQTNWTIIEEIPCRILFAPLYKSLLTVGAVLLFCYGLAVIVSHSTAKRISGPLLHLCDSMNQVKEGNLDVISSVKGYEEVERLKDSFNDMAGTIRRLLGEIRLKERNKREVELDFLRLQINPHFLYNTLFSIQCLTETGRNEEAVYMLGAFITLLRGTLSVNNQYISVEKEIENVEKYLVLQQLRYRDKVSFETDMEEETRQCLMPPFLLQPIVENAVFHGIEGKGDSGMIIIESRIEEENLYLCVSDDGIGMSQEEQSGLLEELQKKKHKNMHKKKDSIGMSNVSDRIRLNFGEAYGIELESAVGIGTTVRLKLPVLREKSGSIEAAETAGEGV